MSKEAPDTRHIAKNVLACFSGGGHYLQNILDVLEKEADGLSDEDFIAHVKRVRFAAEILEGRPLDTLSNDKVVEILTASCCNVFNPVSAEEPRSPALMDAVIAVRMMLANMQQLKLNKNDIGSSENIPAVA